MNKPDTKVHDQVHKYKAKWLDGDIASFLNQGGGDCLKTSWIKKSPIHNLGWWKK